MTKRRAYTVRLGLGDALTLDLKRHWGTGSVDSSISTQSVGSLKKHGSGKHSVREILEVYVGNGMRNFGKIIFKTLIEGSWPLRCIDRCWRDPLTGMRLRHMLPNSHM